MAQSSDHHSELSQSSQALLDKLDELLVESALKEAERVNSADYNAGLEELMKASASTQERIKFAVPEKACQIVSESQISNSGTSSEPFRILSIGCGDGIFDAIILQAMIRKYPDIKLDYTGIDTDKDICQKAREELGALKKTSDKIEIRILEMDMHSLTSEIQSCDLILAMQILYYAVDLRKVLTDVHGLLKTDGYLLILLASPDCPALSHLMCHFWLHEHGWPLKLSDAVTAEGLDALGIKYTTEVIYAELNVTESFRDGFQKPNQKALLDFLTQTRLERYPPTVSQVCIDYLGSVSIGQPEKYVIPYTYAFIVCKNES